MTLLSHVYAEACGNGYGDAAGCGDGAEVGAGHAELREVVARAVLPPAFDTAWRRHLLPRPWFVREEEVRSFARDLDGLFDLLVSLPERLFGGDAGRYAKELGLDPRHAALLRRSAEGRPARLGRADAYHDGTRYRLLEFNLGSEVGGMDMAVCNAALLRVGAFGEFAAAHGLAYEDTAALLAADLRERARPVLAGGATEPVIGLIEGNGAVAAYGTLMRAFQEAMAAQGLDLRIGEVGQLRTRPDGKLSLDGAALDLVLRNFGASQLLDDPAGEAAAEQLFRAHDAGRTVLFTSLESGLFAHKNALGMLSDPRHADAFDAAERALVDRVLPWSRPLGSGAPAELLDLCRERREHLILKPGAGHGGLDTVVGWECTDAEWRAALAVAAERGCLAQERVVPRPEPVPDPVTGRSEEWIAALGFFLTSRGYAGAHARANRADGGAIVGMSSNPDTRMACVFTHA
ncbi:hypothetical protein AB0A60_02850 [Streptomyces sp. NPDC046275]|uniref:hypothetical protein n=1 Tax=Streptomyces sp. NPDC046275 TaxID=3157201 RepID=UPI0033F5F07C